MRALPTLEPQPRAVAWPPGRARVCRAHEDLLALLEVGGEHFGEPAVGDAQPHRDGHRHHQQQLHRSALLRPQGGDRKSTRLNSSHQITSYAVFCLEKNKYTPT